MSSTIAVLARVCGNVSRISPMTSLSWSADVAACGSTRRSAASFCAAWVASTLRFAAQRSIASPESTWLSRIGPTLSTMSLMSAMLVWKSPAIAWVESTRRCSAGPSPPTATAVSSSSSPTFSLGSAASIRLASSRIGPIGAGTVVSVMTALSASTLSVVPADTRSRYCSPTADTECTCAEASAGILYLLSRRMVATAPSSVGSTEVTLPTVMPW